MTLKTVSAMLATVVALGLSARVGAQELVAPQLAVGDTWTFVLRDIFTGLELSSETTRVEASDPQGYRLQSTSASGETTLHELTLDLNIKQRVDNYPSDTGQLNFPLKVGKKWRSVTWYKGRTEGVQDVQQEVVAVEKQKVAAGEFEAYKIVGKGDWIVLNDTSGVVQSDHQGRFERISWYAPAVKSFIIVETRSYAKGHVGARSRTELERFELH